ncbi:hypothetical protein JRO89_XS11G0068400 [Xanthoceras sorbifolium]|uniref:Uncharacterized protein n=1 Tax=Xanthoceras sorbifolium TaxID=99658 RepID=A0ABQ8HEY6_9ROSI|nr:hypothetical protein JRO89_XS11G0068400 [Xanthoceras sorbifolium]
MAASEDDLHHLITDREGKSIYTDRPGSHQQQKLRSEDGKPSNKITEQENSRPRIRKVSDMLRNDRNLEKYYEPRAVSIGPLHYGKNKFSLAEKQKLKVAKLFIKENSLDELIPYNKIKMQIERLKQCYVEEDIKRININDDNLAWKFLFDGFALLHFIRYASIGKLNDLKIEMNVEAFSQQDLFLIENQIPYQVLDEIMTSLADGGANMRNSIDKFIDQTVRDIRGPSFRETSSPTSSQPAPAHLLELLWKRLVGDHEEKKAKTGKTETIRTGQNQKVKTETGMQIRNVNKLKASGIQLKTGTEGPLRDISFASHWFTGTLTLPSLVVDDSTVPKLLNLIAFEMCPDFDNDSQVTSYIFFLHTLIDRPDDVKELQKAHILHNALESDEEVARLFKEICTDLDSIPEAFLEVKDRIQKHCEKKWKTWMGFNNPWTLFALAAAIAVLVMSCSSRLGAPLIESDN